jgi:hypothetical protein
VRELFALLLAFSACVGAQEAKKKPSAKKPELQQSAHSRPTPEQLRRFRQLEEKEKQKK